MKRLAADMLKRLESLEQQQSTRRPVMLVPELLSADAWGAIATPGQAMLKDNIKERGKAPDYGDLPQLKLVVSH